MVVVSKLAFYFNVQIQLKPTDYSIKYVFEKTKNKQNEAGIGLIYKN